jgi:hypothetical protein
VGDPLLAAVAAGGVPAAPMGGMGFVPGFEQHAAAAQVRLLHCAPPPRGMADVCM